MVSAFCLVCLHVEHGRCVRCDGPACSRCDRCFGCGRIICARCDTRPTPRFEFPGDARRHPHNDNPCVLPTTVVLFVSAASVRLDIVCARGCSTRVEADEISAARAIAGTGRCRCGSVAEVQRARFVREVPR